MARTPKPWYWKARSAWFVTISGTRHCLGTDKKKAVETFHKMMANPAPELVQADSLLGLFELFLAWCEQHRSEGTYRWYRLFLQAFIDTIPAAMTIAQLKPFHVQQWVDANPGITNNGKRAKIRAVQRALQWGRQMGYTTLDPLSSLRKPAGESRDVVITPDDYTMILAEVPDEEFRQLLTVAWETGARPQELTAVEARHVELSNSRWVFPRQEAKGKKKPRVVYLSPQAEDNTRDLMARYPEGPLFRNTEGEPWNKNSINCRFQRLKSKLGTKYCLYHFRHSFATRCLKNGADPLTVAEWLGHSDPSMLAKVYGHVAHDPQHMLAKLRQSIG